jgi:TonB family protein
MAKRAIRGWRAATWAGRLGTPPGAGLRADIGRRWSRTRRRTRILWLLALSLLVHLAVLPLLLHVPEPQLARNAGEPSEVDVVMLPPGAPEATTPEREPNPTTPAPPTPEPPAPGQPAGQPAHPEPPAAQAAPQAPPPSPPVPPSLPPVPEEEEALPVPPPLPPAPRPPPRPPPPPPVRRAEPPAPSSFPRPIARSLADLGLGSGVAAPPAPARPQTGRGFNLALGPVARNSLGAVPRNPDTPEAMVRVEGADLGADWLRALHEWWERHGYYPHQAAEQGEDGTTRVRLRVDRSGRVEEAELEMRSGSQWLDLGSLAIFRNAMLPPFPPATPQNEVTLHLTLNFILIRRGG